MGQFTLRVEGLDCPTEMAAIRNALEGKPGIDDLAFDLMGGTVTVRSSDPGLDGLTLAHRLTRATGFRASVVTPGQANAPNANPGHAGHDHGDNQAHAAGGSELQAWLRLWLPVIGSGLSWGVGFVLEHGKQAEIARLVYLLAIAIASVALVPRFWRSVLGRRMDINVLMSLAILGAMALGDFEEAAAVAFLFGLSEALEAMSLDRARNAVRQLLEIAPDQAERIEADGSTTRVPAAEILVGQRVRVRAGERVPVDGRVVQGRSSIDQKAITGESVPVLREPGQDVFAGTVNGEGTLEVEATRPLSDAVVSRVIERVRAAQSGRTPIERTVDRFARVYTPAVVAFAALLMVVPPLVLGDGSFRHWFGQGLVMLVIACPCAFVIGTPVAVVSALAAATRRGILIKGGQFLEAFGRLKVLAFDKTGTLTRGEPDVVEVVAHAGSEAELVRIAAAVGDRGGHVLGRAIARHARSRDLDFPDAEDYQAVPGLGATARVGSTQYHMGSHRYLDEAGVCRPGFHDSLGHAERQVGTAVAVSAPSQPLGWLRLADQPRPEAQAVLAQIRELGIEAVMLTGDNSATAAAMARQLGIGQQRPELLPDEKAAAIAELEQRYGPTGMVGDGVNDAPALAAANVSVALGGVSSGAALETADIVLMSEGLEQLPWLVRHSRRATALIRTNIALAIGAKLVFLGLAVASLATLWMAILADVGVSLLVVANALRLLREPLGGNHTFGTRLPRPTQAAEAA